VLASFFVSNSTLDLGMSTTFSAVVTGGTLPLSYHYSSLPIGCRSQNDSTLFCQPSAIGRNTTVLTVTDRAGLTVTASVTVSVSPVLGVPMLVSNLSEATVGIPFTLTTTVAGGSSPLSYDYYSLPGNCFSGDTSSISCIPGISGNYTVSVYVTDGAGAIGSNTTVVRVNPYPTVSIAATPDPVDLGRRITFTAIGSGGTAPLSYSYEGLPTGCAATNASTITCSPNATGSFNVSVTVSDAFGVVSPRATTVVTVNTAGTASRPSAIASLPWWAWAILALVVIIAIAVVALRRRRKPVPVEAAPTAAESPPPSWLEEPTDSSKPP